MRAQKCPLLIIWTRSKSQCEIVVCIGVIDGVYSRGIYTADFSDIPLVNLLRSIVYPEDEDDSDHGAQLENLQSTSSEPNNSRIEVSVLIHSDVNFRQSKVNQKILFHLNSEFY